MKNLDTIIAPATGNNSAAISVLRVSGPQAFSATQNLFVSKTQKNLQNEPTQSIHFGEIYNKTELIDEVLVSIFKAPHSYTGEDVIEISCHGSPYIQNQIINAFLAQGVRFADPGEFTFRAFTNGKMDLSQAEAVSDLIASESKSEHDIALNQMRGGFSSELKDLREQLIQFAALIELELDFSTEDVEFADRTQLNELLDNISKHIEKLIQSFSFGNVIKKGIPVAIIGKPNAGKSSLLNALLNEDRAIVSDIAGTTRDTIEDQIVIDGVKFRFVDTAGIRDTDDEIESIGVKRAFEAAKKSKIIVFVFDRRDTDWEEMQEQLHQLHDKNTYLLLLESKRDMVLDDGFILEDSFILSLQKEFKDVRQLRISNFNSEDIDAVRDYLSVFAKELRGNNDTVVTHTRHKNALEKADESLQKVKQGLANNLPEDLLAQDLREALYYLGSITGEIDVDQDILGTVFGKFCIGK